MRELTPSQQAALERSTTLEHQILKDPGTFRVLTGDRPTGPLHIGHYLGTLANRVRLQNLGVEVIVLIADYQVMTDRDAGRQLPATVRGVVADYLAAGIDPDRSVIFTHSAVPSLNELVLPFLSLLSDAELHRNPTVKAETEATGKPPTGLMLTYPVHQAADILFCQANLVPVGLDQLPHLETTRLIARRFKERYAAESPLFPEPEALLTASPMLAGLDGKKMSKTSGNGIALQATEDHTAAIIRRAPTDSERRITYDPAGRPAVANMLDLLAAITGDNPRHLADEIGNAGAGQLKHLLTEAVNELLRPLRQRRADIVEDTDHIDAVLDAGNARARDLADNTLTKIHDLLGMTYANRRTDSPFSPPLGRLKPPCRGVRVRRATVQGGAGRTDQWLGGCDVETRRKPEELTEQERLRLHQAHQRLRNASHALEALTVVERVRGRWVAKPAPLDALQAAQDDLYDAGQELWRTQYELLSLQPSSAPVADSQ